MVTAVLLAGGKGTRMKEQVPKQFMLLGGKPILMHSLEKLDAIDRINEIVVVSYPAYFKTIENFKKQFMLAKKIVYVEAGMTRQQSTYNGLMKATNDIVVIHEAARPLVKMEQFEELLDEANPNAIFGYPVPFTVVTGTDTISGILKRDELVNVQLPQKFNRSELIAAHERAKREERYFTEDASLLFYYGNKNIKILKGSSNNLKITEPIDLITAEMLYKEYILGLES